MNELFSFSSLITLQGSAAAAVLVPNVIGYFAGPKFDKYRKWISLAIAMALAYTAAFVAGDGALTWVVAFLNGLLIFASAVGLNQLPRRNRSKPEKKSDEEEAALPRLPKFFTSWT